MWVRADPPPPGLGATMVATVAAADLDEEWELLVLVRDSADEALAQVRGLGTARMLSFSAAAGWALEAEIDGDHFSGQVLDLDVDQDPTDVEIAVETRAGERWSRRSTSRLLLAERAGPRHGPLHGPLRRRRGQQPLGRALRVSAGLDGVGSCTIPGVACPRGLRPAVRHGSRSFLRPSTRTYAGDVMVAGAPAAERQDVRRSLS